MEGDRKIWEDFKCDADYALSDIYGKNIDFLFIYGKKFTKDESLILDTIQDIFYDLIRNRNNLGSTDNIRLYLLKTFRRRILRTFEKNRKLFWLEPTSLHAEPEITFSVEEKIIQDEESAQRIRSLKQAMKTLNARQREVLYYKFTCGFDYDEICEIMSISYDSARQLVSRSIKKLKQKLTPTSFIFLFVRLKEIDKGK
ncbi:sigma-70 family RNA polymerase sigma factor [uncultured Sunxiuqinia sp.]|uniref:RNA polymerase sigma factor n=1 Tax=uncultured Sunxiuqinia sp. TaxID=1573825 RepID=UPI002AA67241|nr:sigma-70 family RNA polymerase sigma factor [uncultured Sunxiuqinia sp.]